MAHSGLTLVLVRLMLDQFKRGMSNSNFSQATSWCLGAWFTGS